MIKRASLGLAALVCVSVLAGCGGSSSPAPAPTPPAPTPAPTPPPTATTPVTISGSVTFDRVPNDVSTNALNYNAIRQDPIRGAVVEAVNAANAVIDTDISDASGAYSVTVPSNTSVRIRVRAQLMQTTGATWNVQVLDNTSNDAPYFLTGSLTSSGASASTRNLNAPSGWDGVQYSSPRAAGPFAILDTIFESLTAFEAVDGAIAFTPLQVFWSVDNNPSSGDEDDGDIGTSFFTVRGNQPMIFILGAANNDTDEYDAHVVAHEFGHYVEATLSRSDSIGGSHNLVQRLDARLAFSEGFGNALSGIVLNDPIYRDSLGASQASGFSINNESNNFSVQGWFAEGSTGSIIFDIGDANDDGPDTISGGLGPIYTALTSAEYTNSPDATTIFLFIDALRNTTSVDDAALTAIVSNQQISGTGTQGIGETNDGGIPDTLPVYKQASVGGPAVQVCSSDNEGDFNNLGNRDYVRFSLASTQAVTLRLVRTIGPSGSDPDMVLFERGVQRASGFSTSNDSETISTTLTPGEYFVETFAFENIGDGETRGDFCFNFTVG